MIIIICGTSAHWGARLGLVWNEGIENTWIVKNVGMEDEWIEKTEEWKTQENR